MLPQIDRKEKPRGTQQPSLLWVFGVCLIAVAALFLGYEVVERLWLGGLKPETLHTLHLLRGLSASAIAAMLATILLLRRIQGSTHSDSILSATPRSWKIRLQRVSLRTKIVVPMVVLAVVPAMVIGVFTISRMRESLRQTLVERIAFDTASRAQIVEDFLHTLQQDLHFLSQLKVVQDLASAELAEVSEPAPILRKRVEEEFFIFSQGKRAYYQVRYLNSSGHELVRLNVENGLPAVVPFERLQDKSQRYYIKETMVLEPGEIYVSPMDLNVEYGGVEVPHRAVLRYATSVSGRRGRGLLVINVYADYLFSLLGSLPPGTEAWWVDTDGTYLGYVGESQTKAGTYSLEKRRHLSQDYSPREASIILGSYDRRKTIETLEALVSFAAVRYLAEAPHRHWTLMISQPRAPINAPIRHLTVFLSVVMVLVIAVAGLLGILVAHYLARPVAILRQATREIAAGDLSKHVEVTTGDEIQGLAIDFNVMTERLHEAQEHLSAWNVELEREVARQTEELQRLQSGLARTDKLASIGQMTAGVMHEVGNPLAAIKTKIQVAEEEADLCADCRSVLSEIIREVDRLSAFLRSFSRLARLRSPQMGNLSLGELVQSVTALVTEELQRKGVSLRVETAEEVPTIRGDADQLRQLLINLVLNAAEASPDGGEILVRVRRLDPFQKIEPAGGVNIDVVDHGLGMSQEIIAKIWDPFFTTKAEGTGLGLAICRQIVQDHGGAIQVRSKPGEGTVVSLTFPPR